MSLETPTIEQLQEKALLAGFDEKQQAYFDKLIAEYLKQFRGIKDADLKARFEQGDREALSIMRAMIVKRGEIIDFINTKEVEFNSLKLRRSFMAHMEDVVTDPANGHLQFEPGLTDKLLDNKKIRGDYQVDQELTKFAQSEGLDDLQTEKLRNELLDRFYVVDGNTNGAFLVQFISHTYLENYIFVNAVMRVREALKENKELSGDIFHKGGYKEGKGWNSFEIIARSEQEERLKKEIIDLIESKIPKAEADAKVFGFSTFTDEEWQSYIGR